MRHEVRVGDQDAWGILVGANNGHWAAGLHQQGFIIVQVFQRGDDTVEIGLCCTNREGFTA